MPDNHSCGEPASWGRILLVVAHPDDETLALGGQLGAVQPGIFHLTTGATAADLPSYASRREAELASAMAMAGIPATQRHTARVPDQQAVDFLPQMLAALTIAVHDSRPRCLLTHPYEGGHPDHDAAALLCAIASTHLALPVYEFTSYHNGSPQGDSASWETGCFLPPAAGVATIRLSDQQMRMKRKLLSLFVSQLEVLERFSIDEELFRPAPLYSFDAPPHPGLLLYESFGWGVTFESWHDRASAGLAAINITSKGLSNVGHSIHG